MAFFVSNLAFYLQVSWPEFEELLLLSPKEGGAEKICKDSSLSVYFVGEGGLLSCHVMSYL